MPSRVQSLPGRHGLWCARILAPHTGPNLPNSNTPLEINYVPENHLPADFDTYYTAKTARYLVNFTPKPPLRDALEGTEPARPAWPRSKDAIPGNSKITKTLVRLGFGVRLRLRLVTNVRVV